MELLQFLANKFHGICHFLSKNSAVGLTVATLQVIPAIQTMGSVTQSYSQTAMFLLQPQSCD